MAKKSFKNNPALQFISAAEEPETVPERVEQNTAPDGYKVNPLYIEKRSKRVQLVLQPSLFSRVKAKAESKGLSLNEYVHQILDEATREEI